jgi:hypothetical protein
MVGDAPPPLGFVPIDRKPRVYAPEAMGVFHPMR